MPNRITISSSREEEEEVVEAKDEDCVRIDNKKFINNPTRFNQMFIFIISRPKEGFVVVVALDSVLLWNG